MTISRNTKDEPFKKKLPLRYVFVSPRLEDLTKGCYVRADTVDKFKLHVQQKLEDSAPNVMEISIPDLHKWLDGAINIKHLDRKLEEERRKARIAEFRLVSIFFSKEKK